MARLLRRNTWIVTVILLTPLLAMADAPDTLWVLTDGFLPKNVAHSVLEIGSGDLFVLGTYQFMMTQQLMFLWASPDGDTLGRAFLGSHAMDYEGFDMIFCEDGGFAIAGSVCDTFYYKTEAALFRISEEGDSLSVETYGIGPQAEARCLLETGDGGFLLAGSTCESDPIVFDVFLVRTDETGEALWTRTYGGSGDEECLSMALSDDGGCLLVGWTDSFGSGKRDVYLLRVGPDGDTLWTATWGGEESEIAYDVKRTQDGGFIVTGSTYSFGEGVQNAFLWRLDGRGETLWRETYGSWGYEAGYAVIQTEDGGYAVTGSAFDPFGDFENAYLLRADGMGDSLWAGIYGSEYSDQVGNDLIELTDGSFVVTGQTADIIFLLRSKPDPLRGK
jgi:hypothetical protein